MKIRARLALAATAAGVLALGLAACSGTAAAPSGASAGAGSSRGAIPLLRIGDDASLSTLDTGTDEDNDVYGTLETLTKFGPDGQIEPDLATSVTQPTATTYVYHLRQGVKFWNGDPMTSADVVNALDYYRKSGSYVSSLMVSVKDVTATGPYTVTVTLKYPYAPWSTQTTGQFPVFEEKFQREHPATMGQPGTLTMGTGPWQIDSFDPTTGLELSANPHWWGGKVPIQHISVKFFASETSEALAFRGGEIDVASDVLNPKAFKSTSGGSIVSAPAFSEGYFGMNVNQPPWNNIHVRRAVAYALNRADVIAALGNNAEPVTTFIPPSELDRLGSQSQVSALINGLPSYQYNLAMAKRELAESPYPHGFTATTQTITFASYTPVNEAIAGDLAKIGINLKLETIGFTQYLAFASGPKSAIGGLYATFNVQNPDPNAFPSEMLGAANIPSGYNWADYDPPASDALIEQAEAAQGNSQRLTIYGQLLKMLGSDVPYVPLYIQDYNVALSGNFTWPGYNVYTQWGDWELNIKPKS
jgi:peptide/nickel transport system substrate-binding protein